MDIFRAFIANLPHFLNFLALQLETEENAVVVTIEITFPSCHAKMAFWGRKSTAENGTARYTESIDSFERRCAHCHEHAFYAYLLCIRWCACAAYRSFTWTLRTTGDL